MSASISSPGGDAHSPLPLPDGQDPDHADRVRGSILAGAVGDAVGYVVEFDRWPAIAARFGADGLTGPAACDGALVVSDDTQMTLFTLEGLTEALRWANEGSAADELACLWLAYLRWYRTQGERLPAGAPHPPASPLEGEPAMRHRRAPGNACLSGLATGEMGTADRPVNPTSKGCGTVMRSAPFGLVPHVPVEAMEDLAARASALTHGHPTAGVAAGAFAVIVGRIARGAGLREAVEAVRDALVARQPHAEVASTRGLGGNGDDANGDGANDARTVDAETGVTETRVALTLALDTATADRERAAGTSEAAGASPSGVVVPADPQTLSTRLGEGWVAEEALAIGVYCALVDAHPDPREHLRRALRRATNHDGDSDSTAAVAGNLVGALHGTAALDPAWVTRVAERDVVERVVDGFLDAVAGGR